MNLEQAKEILESFWKNHCYSCFPQHCSTCSYKEAAAVLADALDEVDVKENKND